MFQCRHLRLFRYSVRSEPLTLITVPAPHNFLDEHPHKDDESRSTVMKLKLLWRRGGHSYHWVESEVLDEG